MATIVKKIIKYSFSSLRDFTPTEDELDILHKHALERIEKGSKDGYICGELNYKIEREEELYQLEGWWEV